MRDTEKLFYKLEKNDMSDVIACGYPDSFPRNNFI